MSPRCLVRGSINIDEFFALPHIVRPGETISSTSITRKSGGKGANQAYAVARGGGNVELDGNISEDGTWIRDLLHEGKVGVERLNTVKEEVTGRAIIQIAEDGENSIVLHKGANFHASPFDSSPNLSGFTHLLLQNEIPLETTLRYLTSSQGLISIFNPSPMLTPAELRQFPWKDLSWLIVNEGELETLLEALSDRPPKKDSGADVLECARDNILAIRKTEYFHSNVSIIVTLGARGIVWASSGSDEVRQLPACKVDKVVDTTGAGDCFAGYFAAGLMRLQNDGTRLEEGLEGVLKTCLAACALCVEKAGAMESYPTLQEASARIAQ